VERVNVERDGSGKITSLVFDKGATVGMGKDMKVATEASFFQGNNAFGVPLLGGVTGSYNDEALGNLTPTGHCKENGCAGAADDAAASPGRPNNVPICPVMASNGLVFNTFGGGGLLVLDSTQTPMSIVGAYGNLVVYGAGVCGEEVSGQVYLTSGVSASSAGADQSMFALYAFDPSMYVSADYQENTPEPNLVYNDEVDTTATGGKTVGDPTNDSGQIPGTTTRRDAHDLAGTLDGKYVHVVDRIKNVVEVFDSQTGNRIGAYDLTTETGVAGDGSTGPCGAASITDGGEGFPTNDPGPDFIDPTPDGKYMMISFRGPAPVSAGHAAQGSCPGVGIVELKDGGASGALVGVLRSTNTVPDNLGEISPAGGAPYTGEERSDIHDVVVVFGDDGLGEESPTSENGAKTGDEEASAGTKVGLCLIAIFVVAFTAVLV
jgi:hypothetical protein